MKNTLCSCLFGVMMLVSPALAQDIQIPPQPEMAGELFGTPIPMDNFYFVLKAVTTFGTPWGGVPSNQEELRKRTEEDLLLSFEAFRRNISVEDRETQEEIDKTLKDSKIEFDRKEDPAAYEAWVKDNLGESVTLFENQIRHLVQLRKLQKDVLDEIEPSVNDDEAFQEFLNEYNTLSVELVQFDDPSEAKTFYDQAVQDPEFWEKQKTEQPDRFKRPGFVALEFLIHMWRFPKDAAYQMLDREVGSIYPPTPIYKGEGVFKILEIRKADPAEFPRLKESYYDQLKLQKKYEGFRVWLDNLRQESGLTITTDFPDLFSPAVNP